MRKFKKLESEIEELEKTLEFLKIIENKKEINANDTIHNRVFKKYIELGNVNKVSESLRAENIRTIEGQSFTSENVTKYLDIKLTDTLGIDKDIYNYVMVKRAEQRKRLGINVNYWKNTNSK